MPSHLASAGLLAERTAMRSKPRSLGLAAAIALAVVPSAARAGMASVVLIPSNLEKAKIMMTAVYGGTVVAVDGTYDDVNRLCSELIGDPLTAEWGFVNVNLRPYYAEGSKTVGYEIAEQLGWQLPDVILYPTGGGTGLVGMAKAFDEMEALGWIGAERPRLVAVQVGGCAPIVRAFEAGATRAEPWVDAHTVASGLRVPSPFADSLILDAVRRTKGTAVSVSEEEMLDAMVECSAAEGVFVCPEGGATLAALHQLLRSGEVSREERIVLYDTGSGLKYPEAWRAALARRSLG